MKTKSLSEIVNLAADQFLVHNAEQSIISSSELSDVFAPPHHGPQNVPINVNDVDHGDNFTHYPIVNTGVYYLFLPHEVRSVEVFDMHYHGPSQQEPSYFPIELEALPVQELNGSPFKQAFRTSSNVIFNQNSPQPIAIHFSVRSDDDNFILKYIVIGENA